MKRVLIACEESQRVCNAFRNVGAEAYSCDLLPCSGGHPEWHFQGNVLDLLSLDWDLIIAHPPCTYLTLSQNKYYSFQYPGCLQRIKKRHSAYEFFMNFVNAPCKHIAIENPVGYMNTHFRKPDFIYHPHYFYGETESKRTCLWLKGLPLLKREQYLPDDQITHNGYRAIFDGIQYSWNDPLVSVLRSRTPYGVARAMAEQWIDII